MRSCCSRLARAWPLTVISRRSFALGILGSGLVGDRQRLASAAVFEDVYVVRTGEPVDIQDIAPGQWRHFEIEGSPVFVHHLTQDEIDRCPISPDSEIMPEKAVSNEWIAVSGICTHTGCRIMQPLGQHGGFVCPCHGSEFDIYGHVVKGPAKRDLATVSHTVSNARLIFLGDAQQRD